MPFFVETEVGGIQKFIGSTGKLKEMIGGSEIIFRICQKDFYDPVLADIGCSQEAGQLDESGNWHLAIQTNAGIFCLLLPTEDKARAFLTAYSRKVLEEFPGLPLFGAYTRLGDLSSAGLRQARQTAGDIINRQRMTHTVPAGLPMLPILRPARLDGLPAVDEAYEGGGREPISLPSRTKRNEKMLTASRDRLRKLVELPANMDWADDLEKMLGPDGGKIALIHMDGNDLGKLFRTAQDGAASSGFFAGIQAMRQLSENIEEINEAAFTHAATFILRYEKDSKYMPLRPLVMGGDDITLIARADIALAFIDLFANRFEELAAQKGRSLSLGIGMVVMDSSWPFARAFTLVESLLENAKRLTMGQTPRPSSLDYLVLTSEVEGNVEALRQRVYTAHDSACLTSWPRTVCKNSIRDFIKDGMEILDQLPRSALRQALTACRKGEKAAQPFWTNLRENLERKLGGRPGQTLMSPARFEHYFPGSFFREKANGQKYTMLGDYLELSRLLPASRENRRLLLEIMDAGSRKDV